MEWKQIIKRGSVSVLLATCLLAGAQTVRASVYTEGNISSTYTTIFQDVIDGLNPLDDYVFYRSGNYEYRMYVGDLDLSNSLFTGQDLDLYILKYNQSGYNQTSYTYEKSNGQSIYLDVGSNLVYSNLGGYPSLVERGDFLVLSQIIFMFIIVLCCLIRPIFNFTWRKR